MNANQIAKLSEEIKGMDKVRQGRARLMISQPFFASCAIGLKLVEDNSQPTAYTDARVIGFNADFINALPIEQVEFLVAHEALHILMLHPLRLQGRDMETANKAGDYVINGILKRAGFDMPEGGLLDDKYSAPGQSFESVYAALKAKENKNGKKPQGQGQGPQGQGQQPGQNTPDNNGNQAPQAPAPGQAPGPQDFGKFQAPTGDDGQELSESERNELESEIKLTATRAAMAARNCGKLPAELAKIVDDIVVQKRDVEDLLREFIVKTLSGDYTYTRPNKRAIIHDLYMPTVQGNTLPEIVMVMDTSGSVTSQEVDYFAAKFNKVMDEFRSIIHVIYCDTKAYYDAEYTPADMPVKLVAKGGGGTDFRPPFKMVQDRDIDPACMIYFTDGCCNSFPVEPDYPVFWAVVGDYRTRFPFGEPVKLEMD